MLKIATLFLVVMVAVALFNRWWAGWRTGAAKPPELGKPQRCPKCKRYLIGKGPCDCGAPHP